MEDNITGVRAGVIIVIVSGLVRVLPGRKPRRKVFSRRVQRSPFIRKRAFVHGAGSAAISRRLFRCQ